MNNQSGANISHYVAFPNILLKIFNHKQYQVHSNILEITAVLQSCSKMQPGYQVIIAQQINYIDKIHATIQCSLKAFVIHLVIIANSYSKVYLLPKLPFQCEN